jgi:hypothetical protein
MYGSVDLGVLEHVVDAETGELEVGAGVTERNHEEDSSPEGAPPAWGGRLICHGTPSLRERLRGTGTP